MLRLAVACAWAALLGPFATQHYGHRLEIRDPFFPDHPGPGFRLVRILGNGAEVTVLGNAAGAWRIHQVARALTAAQAHAEQGTPETLAAWREATESGEHPIWVPAPGSDLVLCMEATTAMIDVRATCLEEVKRWTE